jgi:hypothetical protein
MSAIQVIKIDEGILKYFEMVMNFQNESEEYRKVTIEEFKEELQKSLNRGVAKKEIQWIEKT